MNVVFSDAANVQKPLKQEKRTERSLQDMGKCRGNATLEGMTVWRKYGRAKSILERTVEQRAWDSAILAAAEYVRRRMNYDESLSLEIHGLLTWNEE